MSNKRLESRLYKELSKLNSLKNIHIKNKKKNLIGFLSSNWEDEQLENEQKIWPNISPEKI